MISVLIASFLRSKRPFFLLIRKLAADERENEGERFDREKGIKFLEGERGREKVACDSKICGP